MRGGRGYTRGGGQDWTMRPQAQERLEPPGLGWPERARPQRASLLAPACERMGFYCFKPPVCGTLWSAFFPPDLLRKWGAGQACFLYKGAGAPSTGVTQEVLDSVLRETSPATPPHPACLVECHAAGTRGTPPASRAACTLGSVQGLGPPCVPRAPWGGDKAHYAHCAEEEAEVRRRGGVSRVLTVRDSAGARILAADLLTAHSYSHPVSDGPANC